MEATSQPMSVEKALATGVSSATRCAAAARSAGFLARRATSVSLAVTRQMARAAWVSAFMVMRVRRMSACSMIGRHAVAAALGGAALAALLGVGEGALRRPLGHRHALRADRQPRRVHHDEHDVEAAVLLADEVADGALALLAELHHAGGAGVDAELVLDAGADHVVARAQRAVLVDEMLGHQEQRDAARAGRRVGQAGEHEMDDVVGHLVVAVGDEDLGADDAVAAVGLLHGPRLEQRRGRSPRAARSGSWCRSIRPTPSSAGRALELLAALRLDRVDGAEGEQRAQAEGQVG